MGSFPRSMLTLLAGLSVVLVLQSCGDDPMQPDDTETIEARDDFTFSRPNLTISAGTEVRWVNAGVMLHTVTPDGHSEWSAANLATTGATFTHTFDTPGTYEYYCEPHLGSGMTGTITVN